MDLLSEENMDLVRKVASCYVDRSIADFDDLVQEAYFGLHRAAELYDPARGPFKKYAVYWINHAIRRSIHQTWYRIQLPPHALIKYAAYCRAEERLLHKLRQRPSFLDVMEELGVDEKGGKQKTYRGICYAVRVLNPMRQSSDYGGLSPEEIED